MTSQRAHPFDMKISVNMHGLITLRLAKDSDAKSLFDWRNNPNIRAASEQTKPLIWEDHIKWLTHTFEVEDPTRFGVLEIDQDSKVTQFIEKPKDKSYGNK